MSGLPLILPTYEDMLRGIKANKAMREELGKKHKPVNYTLRMAEWRIRKRGGK